MRITREINKVIVHCSYTTKDMDIGAREIRQWHINDNKWQDIGYHFVIRRNGEVEKGRSLNSVGAHTFGENANSIGICLVGGKPDCNFTFMQYRALIALKRTLEKELTLTWHGHRDFADKACPTFDVNELFRGEVLHGFMG